MNTVDFLSLFKTFDMLNYVGQEMGTISRTFAVMPTENS